MESEACGVIGVELGGATVAPGGTDGVSLARSGDGGVPCGVVVVGRLSDWLGLVLLLVGYWRRVLTSLLDWVVRGPEDGLEWWVVG